MAEANGVAIDRLMRLEFEAAVQLYVAFGVGAVALGAHYQLAALGIYELAVAHAVVVFFIVARREQAADVELFAHGRLGIAGGGEQGLGAATVFVDQAHAD